jgi:hypothetical protein
MTEGLGADTPRAMYSVNGCSSFEQGACTCGTGPLGQAAGGVRLRADNEPDGRNILDVLKGRHPRRGDFAGFTGSES